MLAVVHRFRHALAVGALVSLTACASGGGGQMSTSSIRGTAEVVIVNASRETIYSIHMSPSAQRTWGPDQLGSRTLARGNSFTLTNVAPGRWDIRVQDVSGNYKTFMNQNLRGGRSYTLRVNAGGWRRGS